jgi:catechol 2,3-dioxygenase-like lactoylglutathione lyase family enzyme
MSERPYFHVAYLVEDIHEAMETFSKSMGVEFLDPIVSTARFYQRGREEELLKATITYSKQSSGPYIELVEAQGDGLFRLEQGQGVHHVGMWEPDCEAKVEEMKAKGVDLLAAQYTPEGKIIVAYFAPEDLHGVILEIVDEGRKEMMMKWFSGEPYVD